jgi:glycosyltransferase involved in cell wall biosynthesis
MEQVKSPNWIVSQIGAREHYAIPRSLNRRGHLRNFYTNVWCRFGRSILQRGPKLAQGLAGRFDAELPPSKVVSFTLGSFLEGCRGFFARRAQRNEELYQEYAREGAWFAKRVQRHLERQPLDPDRDIFFSYSTNALESLAFLQSRGVMAIVDQVDPGKVEEDLILQEVERWPGWQPITDRIPEAYYDRIAAEWRAATLVLANSPWSKAALVRQGLPPEKVIVVPLAYEPPQAVSRPKHNPAGVLTVLWIGSVILRKGIPYLIEAAKALVGMPIRFVVAGPLGISDLAVRESPSNVEFMGPVSRMRTRELYLQADLFVLPTMSDGFAMTQLEAMAHGLPVIATRNCGEVVTDGVDGLLVEAGDSHALASAIMRLHDDRALLSEMSARALEKSKLFSLDQVAESLEGHVAAYRKGVGIA